MRRSLLVMLIGLFAVAGVLAHGVVTIASLYRTLTHSTGRPRPVSR